MQCTRQKLRVWTVDAFSSQPFGGNPAAVCIIDDYNVPLCKLIAREMKHAETAFVIPRKCSASSDGSDSKSDDSKKDNTNNCNGNVANLIGSVLNQCNNYDIRWWTPIGKEINMCGHATLAAAHILYSEGFADCNEKINFNCLLEKTTMSVSIVDNKNSINSNESFLYEMNFPKIEFHKLSLNLKENSDSNNKIIDTICKALNVDLKEDIDTIIKGDNGKYLMINVKFDVRKVKPDLDIIKQLPYRCCIVTCDSSKCIDNQLSSKHDFVSRVFGPAIGVPEDNVSGNAHRLLCVYWSEKKNKSGEWLSAYQASLRTGHLMLKYLPTQNDRVLVSGYATTVLDGFLNLKFQ